MLLLDMPTARPCGLALIFMVNGEPRVDLTTMVIAYPTEPVLAVLIHSLEDLHKLEHFVLWTPAFQQLSEKIMAMDLAKMPRGRLQ